MKMYSFVMNCLIIFFFLDKYKRFVLIYVVMNGNVNVLFYLLYLGLDLNRVDSFGNFLIYYVVAYGWYFVFKLFVNEGGVKFSVVNDW